MQRAKGAPLLQLAVDVVIPQKLYHCGVVAGAIIQGLITTTKEEERQGLSVPRNVRARGSSQHSSKIQIEGGQWQVMSLRWQFTSSAS